MSILPKNKLKYWIGLSKIPSIGPIRFSYLLEAFPDIEEAWRAPQSLLIQAGLTEKIAGQIIESRTEINPEQEHEKVTHANLSVITLQDEHYPSLLKEIYGPPPILFYRGILPKPEQNLLAVVGSRKYSSYGKQVTDTLIHELAQNGVVIVSGLALGIDAFAHHATLEAGGITIGVLGSSPEHTNIYPKTNQHLATKIIEHGGCVISEHPPETPALKQHFPRRNRIIAGLSFGTLIIEAAEKSGALITARFALEQNREVFAIPGSIINPTSTGTNNLLKMGARPVTEANDVLSLLNITAKQPGTQTQIIIPDSKEEALIIPHLSQSAVHINQLARLTNLSIQVINATLTLMEMKGKVRHLGSMNYVVA